MLELADTQWKHLSRGLRRSDGDAVSYTDGFGRIGEGTVAGRGVARGAERDVPRPVGPVMAVAPPGARERVRFLVEKLAELGVMELWWLTTRRGEGRPPSPERVGSWRVAALEQRRGAWLMTVAAAPVDVASLPAGTRFADRGGGEPLQLDEAPCVAIGPEGGWAADEVPAGARRVSLSDSMLRVETAAIAAAVRAFPPFTRPL